MNSVLIQIDHVTDVPIRDQIIAAYAAAILDGRLSSGSKLPSIRALSARLKVSPATVVAAYRELTSRALVSASPRSGFCVSGEARNSSRSRGTLQMNRIEPDLRIHPVREFLRILSDLDTTDSSVGGYEDYRGFLGLREILADMDRMDGIFSEPETGMIITSGAQQAINLIAHSFPRNARIGIENPGYPGARIAFQNVGADIFPVRTTNDGPDAESFAAIAIPGRISALYCCPTYGNPRGWSWSETARIRVLEAARSGGFLIIEDDYLGDLDYLGENPPRLAHLAAEFPGVSVVRIRTFSKTLLPALRIASVSGERAFMNRLLSLKVSDDLGSSAILQRGLALFLRNGRYTDHLTRVRPRYRAARAALREALSSVGEGLSFDDPPAGLCLLGRLSNGIDLSRFADECAKDGVIIAPGRDYWLDGANGNDRFRIGFASLSPEEIARAVRVFPNAAVRAREYTFDHSLI